MGGCATKPRDLKAEADAPPPLDEPSTGSDPKVDDAVDQVKEEKKEVVLVGEAEDGKEVVGVQDEQDQPDENRRRSLGVLFKEGEGGKESSEETETVTLSPVETKGEADQPKTEEQPVEESEPRTADNETQNLTQEEHSAPIEAVASENTITDEKTVEVAKSENEEAAEAVEKEKEHPLEKSEPRTVEIEVPNPTQEETSPPTDAVAASETTIIVEKPAEVGNTENSETKEVEAIEIVKTEAEETIMPVEVGEVGKPESSKGEAVEIVKEDAVDSSVNVRQEVAVAEKKEDAELPVSSTVEIA